MKVFCFVLAIATFLLFPVLSDAHEFKRIHFVIIGTPDTPLEDYGDVIPSWEATASDWDDTAKHSHEGYETAEGVLKKVGNKFLIFKHTHDSTEFVAGGVRRTDVGYYKGPAQPRNFSFKLTGTTVTFTWKPARKMVMLKTGRIKIINELAPDVTSYIFARNSLVGDDVTTVPIGDIWEDTGVDPEAHNGDSNHLFSMTETIDKDVSYSFIVSAKDIRNKQGPVSKLLHVYVASSVGNAPSLQRRSLTTMWAKLKKGN